MSEREREGERVDTKCLTREREREREREGVVFEYSCDTILVTIYRSSYSSCRRWAYQGWNLTDLA